MKKLIYLLVFILLITITKYNFFQGKIFSKTDGPDVLSKEINLKANAVDINTHVFGLVSKKHENITSEDRWKANPDFFLSSDGGKTIDCRAMWEKSVGMSDTERFSYLKDVALNLSAMGMAHEALEMTLKTFGPGMARCSVINSIFVATKDIETYEKCYLLLDLKDEKESALRGISTNLSLIFDPTNFDFSKFSFVGDQLDFIKSNVSSSFLLSKSMNKASDISKMFDDVMEIKMSKEAQKLVIQNLISHEPFSCWDHAMIHGIDTFGIDTKLLIEQMIDSSPEKTIKKISLSLEAVNFLDDAFIEWMKIDASKPIEWINQNSGSFSHIQKDKAYLGISNYATQQGDLIAAKLWSDLIQDEAIRAEVMKSD